MGMVGWGRAFNLRFMPNGPLRTNCYHRPMPRMGIFGGGHVSITENINIQHGPSGFWGFMTGLTQGLFGGGMFGMGMGGGMFGMGGFSPFGFLNSNPTLQGAQQPQVSEDKSLKNLIQVYGSDYEIVSHPKKEGFYQAHSKKGGELIEGDYDTVMKKLAELKEKEDPAAVKKDTPEEAAKTHKPPLTKGEDGKWKDASDNEYIWDDENKCFDKQEKTTTAGKDPATEGKDPAVEGKDPAVGAGGKTRTERPDGPAKPQRPAITPKASDTRSLKDAEADGKKVSDYLVGYTTDSQQELTTQIIKNKVNSENVASFLKGYEDNKGMGDHFFAQLKNEWGFPQKDELISHVAQKLIEYCKKSGQNELAAQIKEALDGQHYVQLDRLRAQVKLPS